MDRKNCQKVAIVSVGGIGMVLATGTPIASGDAVS
jgi:hypothetical protein